MTPTFVEVNDLERRRLYSLTASLSGVDLVRVLPSGLTVASALVHLAFWDEYCDALLLEWQGSGFAPVRGDLDAINAAVGAIALAVPASAAIVLACEAADRADSRAARLSPELVATIESEGYSFIFNRAVHRRFHLDQIARVVAA